MRLHNCTRLSIGLVIRPFNGAWRPNKQASPPMARQSLQAATTTAKQRQILPSFLFSGFFYSGANYWSTRMHVQIRGQKVRKITNWTACIYLMHPTGMWACEQEERHTEQPEKGCQRWRNVRETPSPGPVNKQRYPQRSRPEQLYLLGTYKTSAPSAQTVHFGYPFASPSGDGWTLPVADPRSAHTPSLTVWNLSGIARTFQALPSPQNKITLGYFPASYRHRASIQTHHACTAPTANGPSNKTNRRTAANKLVYW